MLFLTYFVVFLIKFHSSVRVLLNITHMQLTISRTEHGIIDSNAPKKHLKSNILFFLKLR